MSIEDQVVFGLKIKLKKVRSYVLNGENIGEPPIVALGHYDFVEIEQAKTLSDFRPAKSQNMDDDNLVTDSKYASKAIYTEYILKLVAIHNEVEKTGIDGTKINNYDEEYKYWQAQDRQNSDLTPNKEKPFIAIISVDIKDECIRELAAEPRSHNLYAWIVSNICSKSKRLLGENDTISLAPYYCLGYTDFVIMARSHSLSVINDYIKKLRESKEISSTYTIFCIKRNANESEITDEKLLARFEWNYIKSTSSGKDLPFIQQIASRASTKSPGMIYGIFDNYAEMILSEKELYKLFNEHDPYSNCISLTGDGQPGQKPNKIIDFNTIIHFNEK